MPPCPIFVGALDQGTSSSRFLIFSFPTWEIISMHQTAMNSIYPFEGWVEQDPYEILSTALVCIRNAVYKFIELGNSVSNLITFGITNQRETIVLWDKNTGDPLYNAIVWQDNRTQQILENTLKLNGFCANEKDCLKELCGLPISTYFSAGKVKWLLDNVPNVKTAIAENRCLFGTVDTWLIWNLTRKPNEQEGLHITDVTNACRTMLMNIKTLKWDEKLCKFFGIPMNILPEIRSSSEIYAKISISPHLKDIPISSILGDQQAALVGMRCLKPGMAKNTYGTGCFLLLNTGHQLVYSKHGLLSTVAYKLGADATVHYALEGSVAIAGAAISWLVKNLGIMYNEDQTESFAKSVESTNGCYFVPAFSGLYAPHWDANARGTICGMTHMTNKGHLVRATLEAIAFQTKEIFDAMNLDALALNHLIKSIHVDGGMATNKTLMQIQSDIAGVNILRHDMLENTALGAAMAAANAKGIDVFDINNSVYDSTSHIELTTFKPLNTEKERKEKYVMWRKAIRRSLYWEGFEDIYEDKDADRFIKNGK